MKDIKLEDILSHYNIIGLSIGIGLGTAGQQFLFSLVNDIIVPAVSKLLGKGGEFKTDSFISHLITFVLVVIVILISLKTALSIIVDKEVSQTQEKNQETVDTLSEIVKKEDQIIKVLNDISETLSQK